LFHLQDDIARRVVEALSLPLGRGAASPSPDAPRNAEAYELYLRANEAARDYETLPRARDLYEQSLALDANFAPAWAQLGRCHRVIGKFLEPLPDSELRAEQAFRRALELNPRFSVAHKFYANLEAEIGQSQQALVRLVQQAIRHGNDPELFAGLVHACRYCGLFAESIAAHEEARRLDPGVPTSVAGTLLLAGETERLVDGTSLIAGGGDYGLRAIALGLAGRRAEARVALNGLREASRVPLFQSWVRLLTAWLDYRGDELLAGFTSLERLKIQSDPEAMFQEAWLLCDVGQHQAALPMLQRAIAKGYSAAPTLTNSHHFDQLRSDPAFQTLLAEAEVGRRRAREAFREAGGERLLGRVPQ
jgi:tetratricopeptide (TPR) repeat protein